MSYAWLFFAADSIKTHDYADSVFDLVCAVLCYTLPATYFYQAWLNKSTKPYMCRQQLTVRLKGPM